MIPNVGTIPLAMLVNLESLDEIFGSGAYILVSVRMPSVLRTICGCLRSAIFLRFLLRQLQILLLGMLLKKLRAPLRCGTSGEIRYLQGGDIVFPEKMLPLDEVGDELSGRASFTRRLLSIHDRACDVLLYPTPNHFSVSRDRFWGKTQ